MLEASEFSACMSFVDDDGGASAVGVFEFKVDFGSILIIIRIHRFLIINYA